MNFDPVSVTEWISAYGLIALFAVALMERFVPVIPSFGLLLAVGFAAAEGTWPLAVAILVTVAGNILGATVCFYIFRRLDEARSTSLLNKSGSLFRVPVVRISCWIEAFRRHQIILAFSLQLVPTVRLFAPAFAGLLRSRPASFLIASAVGIVSWNGFFISIGYFAQSWTEGASMAALNVTLLGFLLVTVIVLLRLLLKTPGQQNTAGIAMHSVPPGTNSVVGLPSKARIHENL